MADLLDNTPAPEIDPAADASADVRASIAQLKGEAPPETTADPAAAPVADAPIATERPRNERGQFIKADGTVDPDQSPVKVPDADPAKATPDPASQPAVEAPKGWSAEAKAEFGKLSPAVQQAVIKRESEINEGGARWSEEKKTLLSHFEPVREISEQYKAHPGEVIKRLAAADRFLERDPDAAIRWLAQAYKVDLSQLAATPAAQTPTQPQADPVVAELKSELSSVKQRLEAEDQAKVNSVITEFATAKDATGQPLRPHWDAVKEDVGYRLLEAAQRQTALTLEDAYDAACYARKDIRALLTTAQTVVDPQAKAREAAEKARRGALSAHGAPNGAVTPPARPADPNATIEDDVKAAIAQLRH